MLCMRHSYSHRAPVKTIFGFWEVSSSLEKVIACGKYFYQHTSVNMNWQLTEGAINTLLTGGSVSCPVLQILGCKKILGEDRYRLLLSDGHHISSSVILSEKLNDKLISGELSNYCVVRVDHCVVEEEQEKNLLSILELTILAKGQEVNRKIGKLVSFTEGKCDPAEVNRNWKLTEGAMATIMTGGSVSCPVFQFLGSKRIMGHGPSERYRILVSDGCHLNSFVMLSTQLNDMLTSGELSDFAVVRVDRWVVSKVQREGRSNNRMVMIVLKLTTLARGHEVGRTIGQPVALPEAESDLPAVAPPAVAPEPAAVHQHPARDPDWQLSQGALATILTTGGSVSCPVLLQLLGKKQISPVPNERYRLLVSDGRNLNSFVMLATQLNDKVTSGELSDFSVVLVDRWITSQVQAQGRPNRRVMIILELTILARGQEVRRKIGQPVSLPEDVMDPPAEAQPAVAPAPIDWHAVERHRFTRLHATFACAFLRRAIALSPEQLRVVLNRVATWRSFSVHELFRSMADLPLVQMHAAVRRVITILSRQAAHRRAAAA